MNSVSRTLIDSFEEIFQITPTVFSRAPGRIEFIGNHTDYNGGEVLGAAVELDLRVAFAPRSDGRLRLARGDTREVVEYSEEDLSKNKATGWTAYPLGVREVLMAKGWANPDGFDFLVQSELPSGSGLSSSAAFELASSFVFESTAQKDLDMLSRVRVCRQAENEYVGVPCGILDQGVSGFGQEDCLVHIDCRTEEIQTVAGLSDVMLWVFQSGTKHSLVESMYSTRHQECSAALNYFSGAEKKYQYLVDVKPETLEDARGHLDPSLWKRAYHVIHEHARVRQMMRALQDNDPLQAGKLLRASHESSSSYFENSTPELDTLVELLCQEDNVYGARLTGGGFGGAVMAMTSNRFRQEQADDVARLYRQKHNLTCDYFSTKASRGASLLT